MTIRMLRVITDNKEKEPNKLTLEAMKEAKNILKSKNKQRFNSTEKLLSSLNS